MTTINFEDIKLADEERQPCEVWTRVMGYFRPVSEFNKGKSRNFTLAYASLRARLFAAVAATIWILRLNSFSDSILR